MKNNNLGLKVFQLIVNDRNGINENASYQINSRESTKSIDNVISIAPLLRRNAGFGGVA
jgi:hypothetical protein